MDMFDINCPVCGRRYLMGESSIERFQNTDEGPIAYLHCYSGHPLVRYFRAENSRTELAETAPMPTLSTLTAA